MQSLQSFPNIPPPRFPLKISKKIAFPEVHSRKPSKNFPETSPEISPKVLQILPEKPPKISSMIPPVVLSKISRETIQRSDSLIIPRISPEISPATVEIFPRILDFFSENFKAFSKF